MKLPVTSLRTSVMAYLAFLIFSAMLLMNVVMLKFMEKDLIQRQIHQGSLLGKALEGAIGCELGCNHKSIEMLGTDQDFKAEFSQLLESSIFTEALLLDKTGARVLDVGEWGQAEKNALSLSRECLSTRRPGLSFSGSTWGVFWLSYKRFQMSSPVFVNGRLAGIATIGASLRPLYEQLRKTEGTVMAFIVLNTIVLVLFGMYLLSKTVVNPIRELLTITEEYKDSGSVPSLKDPAPNEIGQLFRSLNVMLMRLDNNKEELREHIVSLESANQAIKKAQDDIIRSEKQASVGRLATGVAHEIGNPIGILLGYLELLKDDHLSQGERQDFLQRMESEITRINQIIRDLLDFSRSSAKEVRPVPVHALIEETLEMLRPQPMMAHITVESILNATRDEVSADPNQLKQVFLNIIINAADAMEDSSPEQTADNILTIETADRQNHIEIRWTDTGPGIRQEDLAHIFDPFYTTKDPGKGTGLGLSVCYSIVTEMKGTIRAANGPGKGLSIVIEIPLAA